MIQEWDLSQTNLDRVSKRKYEVAVLPTSAIEPHNWHLPYGEDWLHTAHVAKECCKRAWENCESVLYLPGIPYGVDCNLMDFPLAMHVSQTTLNAMVRDLITSLHTFGIRKIVLFNGHGGNDFGTFVRQIQCDLDVHVFQCHWWRVGSDRYGEIFERPDDHAGELETSVALALFPELVEFSKAAKGPSVPFRFEALEEGWVKTSRRFGRVNDHCAVGDPSAATAEKGQQYLELVYERISAFLAELAKTPIDEHFPHQSEA